MHRRVTMVEVQELQHRPIATHTSLSGRGRFCRSGESSEVGTGSRSVGTGFRARVPGAPELFKEGHWQQGVPVGMCQAPPGGVGDCELCHGLGIVPRSRTDQSRRARPGGRRGHFQPHLNVSSEEEVLVRSNRGRHVVPRIDGELPATVPTSQTAFIEAGRWVSPEQVPLHVLDALEEELDGGAPRWPRSSEFALPVQNRFAALDPTVRDSNGLRPTSVDVSGVQAFPMTDDAAVQVSVEPVRRRPCRRFFFDPADESEDGEQFRVSHHGDTQRGPSDFHAEDGFEQRA